jgi:hypothetical protein
VREKFIFFAVHAQERQKKCIVLCLWIELQETYSVDRKQKLELVFYSFAINFRMKYCISFSNS